jgi:hypothetical protein
MSFKKKKLTSMMYQNVRMYQVHQIHIKTTQKYRLLTIE